MDESAIDGQERERVGCFSFRVESLSGRTPLELVQGIRRAQGARPSRYVIMRPIAVVEPDGRIREVREDPKGFYVEDLD